jgi:hypothetical protein
MSSMNTKKLSAAQNDFLAMIAEAGGTKVFEGLWSGYARTMKALEAAGKISVSIEHAPHINVYTVKIEG